MVDDYYEEEEYNEFKQIMEKQSKHAQRYQQEITQKQNDQLLNQFWNEALQEENMDPQAYATLASQDPEQTKALLKQSMRHVVAGVKKGGPGRDSRTGQFTKASPKGRSEREALHHGVDPERLDQLREKAKSGRLTDTENEEAIDMMIGRLF